MRGIKAKYYCPACKAEHLKSKPCKFTFFYEGRVCNLGALGEINILSY
jgi:hypothetical protein